MRHISGKSISSAWKKCPLYLKYRVRMTEEFWGQVGSPTQNENHLRQMLELVEGEIFDEEPYSLVTCVQEVGDDLTWCIQ